MDWNEARDGKEEVVDKQDNIMRIEELRLQVGVRCWPLDGWREADYARINPSDVSPEDLANLSELHELLYFFYEQVLTARAEWRKPNADDEEAIDKWSGEIIDRASELADNDVKGLMGWKDIEKRWNRDKTFRSMWKEVGAFDDILRNMLDVGNLCRRIISWHSKTETQKHERHHQMIEMRELIKQLRDSDTTPDE